MSAVSTRIVSFGDSSIQIDYDGPDAARVVDFLYRDIPRDRTIPAHVTFELRSERGVVTLCCGDRRRYEGPSVGLAAGILLDDSIFHLADKSRNGLLLHAAAVHCDGRCLLLPGKTGAGKTTLTAWLTRQGFGYLTDELVYIPLGSRDVQSLSRPLSIKTAARETLASHLDFTDTTDLLTGPNATLVRSSKLNPKPVRADAVGLSQVVFPRYQAGSDFEVVPLAKALAALRLTECLINARNLPANGFHEVARLLREVPSHELVYSDFGQLGGWMKSVAGAIGGSSK